MENTEITIVPREEIDAQVNEFQNSIDELRKDGITKVRELNDQISITKHDKTLEKSDKLAKIADLKEQLLAAKQIAKDNRLQEKQLCKETKEYLKPNFKAYYKKIKLEGKEKTAELKATFKQNTAELKEKYATDVAEIKEAYAGADKQVEYKSKLKNLERAYRSNVYDVKVNYEKACSNIKDDIHNEYRHYVHLLQNINGIDLNAIEKLEASWERYAYKFTIKDYLYRNGLYIVMILTFVACAIAAPLLGKASLVEWNSLMGIMENAAPRIFLAIGVAGLILLAGTDLSIGRMVGMGSIITCMILHDGPNSMPLFGIQGLDFNGLPGWFRIILALVLTILFCTLFSAAAGFFTAKFKIHPFISTLSTQLIIYGITAVVTSSKNTGPMDSELMAAVGGRVGSIPLLLIYAIIGVIIVSIIWNRTKFGKNMYAVGGNPEAASVSGINVFWVTLGVFIMAGVLYGFGSFFESIRLGTGKFDTGNGYELDAIAACVVGGISFSGGIGKLKGAVIGAIIFTALTVALTRLGISPFYQFIIKGVIIITAVTMDSMKYLKKK